MELYCLFVVFIFTSTQIYGLQVIKIGQSIEKLDNETFTISITLFYTTSKNDPTVIEINEYKQKFDGELDPHGWSSIKEPGKITSTYKMIVRPYPEDDTIQLEDYVVYYREKVLKFVKFVFDLRKNSQENAPVMGTIDEDVMFRGNEFIDLRAAKSPLWIETPDDIINCRQNQTKTVKWKFYSPRKEPPIFYVYYQELKNVNDIAASIGQRETSIYTYEGHSGKKRFRKGVKLHYTRERAEGYGYIIEVKIRIKRFLKDVHPGLYGVRYMGTEYGEGIGSDYNSHVVMRYGRDSFFDSGDLDVTLRHGHVIGEWERNPKDNTAPQPQGHPLHLTCYVLGHHVTRVQWMKDNEILSEQRIQELGGSTKVVVIKGVDFLKSDLQFSNFKAPLSGLYTCRAEAKYGVAKEVTYDIQGYSLVEVNVGVSSWNQKEAHIGCSLYSKDRIFTKMSFLTKEDYRTKEWTPVDLHSDMYNFTIISEEPRQVFGELTIKKSYWDVRDDLYKCAVEGEQVGLLQKGHENLQMLDFYHLMNDW